MNPLYEELELKPKKKYEQAKKDFLDAVHSVDKAIDSFNELSPQQKYDLIIELKNIGIATQCLNCMNQNYKMK